MESTGSESDRGDLFIADLHLRGIAPLVQDAPYFQTRRRPRVGDQFHDDRVGEQWLPSPVTADEREQPMLDLVPLARSRRQMAYMNRQARHVRESLQFQLP